MKLQKTIKSEIKLAGKGLFCGEDVKLVMRPAQEDTGIVFLRTDLAEPVRIPVSVDNIADRDRRTALKKGSVAIETPEHCLSAISAMGIDNLIIEIDGLELHLEIRDGTCRGGFGPMENPDLKCIASRYVFLHGMASAAYVIEARMRGEVKVIGRWSDLMKIRSLTAVGVAR